MCGITGVVSRSEPVQPAWLRAMTEALRHRGPDDEGYLVLGSGETVPIELAGADTRLPLPPLESFDGRAAMILGHRRLSILDLSVAGHQPMGNRSRDLWIVYNGEIYNHPELRDQLRGAGYEFRSGTDTEVLLAAYDEWGEDCLHRLDGMWSFVVYDARSGSLFGARDRFGVKPLYFAVDDERFSFASEIKALVDLPFVGRRLNEAVAFDFLVYDWLSWLEETLFEGVLELLPGHAFRLDLASWRLDRWRYYQLEHERGFEPFEPAKARHHAERLHQLLERSVRRRLRADVPVGSCLSGGLDSSSIVCLSGSLLADGEHSGTETVHRVFTTCFREPEADERRWAELVARHAGAEWYQTYPSAEELLDDVEDLTHCQDLPFVSPSLYAQYRVMRLAREHGMTVLLDGQGGDELLTGYTIYYEVFLHELLGNLDLAGFAREWRGLSNSPLDRRAATTFLVKQLRRHLLPYRLVSWQRKRRRGLLRILEPDFWDSHRERWELLRVRDHKSLNTMLYELFSRQKLSHLMRYEDRNSMRFSIEARTPFVDDRELVEYVFSIPGAYKIHDGWSKYLLRQAMRGVVPEELLGRRDKLGFATPERAWLDALWPRFIEPVTEATRGIVDRQAADARLWPRLRAQGGAGTDMMWRLISFALWRRVFRV